MPIDYEELTKYIIPRFKTTSRKYNEKTSVSMGFRKCTVEDFTEMGITVNEYDKFGYENRICPDNSKG